MWTFALQRGSASLQPDDRVLSLFRLVVRERRCAGGLSDEKRILHRKNSNQLLVEVIIKGVIYMQRAFSWVWRLKRGADDLGQ